MIANQTQRETYQPRFKAERRGTDDEQIGEANETSRLGNEALCAVKSTRATV